MVIENDIQLSIIIDLVVGEFMFLFVYAYRFAALSVR